MACHCLVGSARLADGGSDDEEEVRLGRMRMRRMKKMMLPICDNGIAIGMLCSADYVVAKCIALLHERKTQLSTTGYITPTPP